MPGVGRKTANLTVAVGFDLPAICVDVHVHRISNRLGLVRTKTPFETEMALRRILPPCIGPSCAPRGSSPRGRRTDDNCCRLHAVKPDKCRTFPHAWTNPDSHAVCPELGASNSMPQGGRT